MRTQYANGNEISLTATGCDGCSPSMVNGVLCHEHGCPEAWQDMRRECPWCGARFLPEHKDAAFCNGDCEAAYYGY